MLYNYKLRFDTTTTLLNFLTSAGEQVRRMITDITIVTFAKGTVAPALTMLADCRNIQRIHLVSGVGVNSTPAKASKAFFADAGRLISALATQRNGDKDAAMLVFSFGVKKCFTTKGEEGEVNLWDEDEIEEFKETVKNKVK